MTKISAVLNTYNAALHLNKVLDSLTQFDEILVCDMESTDETLEIARRHGCRIVTFQRGEHRICEPARDFAIHSATYEWVLVIDADEIVTPDLRNYLYERVADDNFKTALLIPRRNTFMGKPATGSPDYQLRFFKKDLCKWPPIIHARPQINGPIDKIPSNRRELYLKHLDNPTVSERVGKLNRYTDYEVSKRGNKKFGILKLLFRPAWFFIRSFVLNGGFRDGKRGVSRAYLDMFYQAVFISKILEKSIDSHDDQHNSSN